jgi:hypothetical protein
MMVSFSSDFNNSQETYNMILIGFMVYISLPVLLTLYQQLLDANAPEYVMHGSFCMKPGFRVRFNRYTGESAGFNICVLTFVFFRPNVFAVGGILFEFLQHAYFSLPKSFIFKQSSTSFTDLLEMNIFGASHTALQLWLAVACVAINSIVILIRIGLYGKHVGFITRMKFIWHIVYFISGPAYVAILVALTRVLDCTKLVTEYPFEAINSTNSSLMEGNATYTETIVLTRQPEIACWEGPHLSLAWAAFFCIAFHITQATLLPAGGYKETMRTKRLDIFYVPLYLKCHFLLKGIFAVTYAWGSAAECNCEATRVAMLAVINLFCLILNVKMLPCSLQRMNRLRTATFSSAVWIGICSLCIVRDHDDFPASEDTQSWSIIMATGTLLLFLLQAGLYKLNYQTDEKQVLWNMHLLLGDKHEQLKVANNPRALERLIALAYDMAKWMDGDVSCSFSDELLGTFEFTLPHKTDRIAVSSHPGRAHHSNGGHSGKTIEVVIPGDMPRAGQKLHVRLPEGAQEYDVIAIEIPGGRKNFTIGHFPPKVDRGRSPTAWAMNTQASENHYKNNRTKELALMRGSVIDKIPKLLNHFSRRVQFQSAWVCGLLSQSSDEFRRKLDEGGVTKRLYNLATNKKNGGTLRAEAMSALANVLQSSAAVESLVKATDGEALQAMVEAVRTDPATAPFAAMVIHNMAMVPEFQSELRLRGAVPALVTLAFTSKTTQLLRLHALQALSVFSFNGHTSDAGIYAAAGIMRRLLKLTGSFTTQLASATVTLLLNLSHHDNLLWLMLEHKTLSTAVKLRDHSSPRVRRLAALLTGSLLAATCKKNLEMEEDQEHSVLKCCGYLGHWAVEDRAATKAFSKLIAKGLVAVANKAIDTQKLKKTTGCMRRCGRTIFGAYAELPEDHATESEMQVPSKPWMFKAVPPPARVVWQTWSSRLDGLEALQSLSSRARVFVCTPNDKAVIVNPMNAFEDEEEATAAIKTWPKHGDLHAVEVAAYRVAHRRSEMHASKFKGEDEEEGEYVTSIQYRYVPKEGYVGEDSFKFKNQQAVGASILSNKSSVAKITVLPATTAEPPPKKRRWWQKEKKPHQGYQLKMVVLQGFGFLENSMGTKYSVSTQLVHNSKTTNLQSTSYSEPHHGGQPVFATPLTFNWEPTEGKCGMLQMKIFRTSPIGPRVVGRVFVRLDTLRPGKPICETFPICDKRKQVIRSAGELQLAFHLLSCEEVVARAANKASSDVFTGIYTPPHNATLAGDGYGGKVLV